MKKEYICIVCPNSCRLSLEDNEGELSVSGNKCPRGRVHAIKEYTAPERMLTTTVKIKGADIPRLPVESVRPLPRNLINEALEELYKLCVNAPVKCGDTIMEDICGSGVSIRACRSLMRKGK